MKKTLLFAVSMLLLIIVTAPTVKAQSVDAGLDIYSSYLWRGYKFGSGAALQPWVEFSAGGFALGAWGSYSTGATDFAEADLYASYGVDLGENASLSFTLTDYYYPGSSWTEWKTDGVNNHFLEPMVSASFGAVSLTAAYVFYEGAGVDGDGSGDLYLEAGVTAGPVDITIGGGTGSWYSGKDDYGFDICNIGVSTSKEIQITENWSLPISGAAIVNPAAESFHVVVGISL